MMLEIREQKIVGVKAKEIERRDGQDRHVLASSL
jgi:hypothetical protein